MKLHYYPETDSLYFELKVGSGAKTREVSDGLNVSNWFAWCGIHVRSLSDLFQHLVCAKFLQQFNNFPFPFALNGARE